MKQKPKVADSATDLIRTSRAPDEFKVGRSKFQHWLTSGFIPVFSPDGAGSRTRFVRRSDVEKFIMTGQPVAA